MGPMDLGQQQLPYTIDIMSWGPLDHTPYEPQFMTSNYHGMAQFLVKSYKCT